MSTDNTREIIVDAKGLICPEPVMMLHTAVRDAQPGQTITLLSTDPASERDVEKFCRFLNHSLIRVEKVEELWTFVLQKGDK